jgi:hypothetical protein
MLSEFVFSPVRDNIRQVGPLDGWDKLAPILTGSLGAANDLTNRLFGVETQVALRLFRGMNARGRPPGPRCRPEFRWRRGRATADRLRREATWGLQLEVRW